VNDRRGALRVLAWPARRRRSLNAYGTLLYDQLERGARRVHTEDWTPLRALLRGADLWHVHFPDALLSVRSLARASFNVAAFALLLSLARVRGSRIVWTIHDLESADALHPRLAARVQAWLARRVDGILTLSRTAHDLALDRHPCLRRLPVRIVPHGHYRGAYADTCSRDEARERLGVPAGHRVVLCFGRVRRYKNVPALIEAFRAVPNASSTLLVAGEVSDDGLERDVRAAAAGDPRVRLHLGRVAEDEVQHYFRAADLVALAYARILHSGVLLLALSFDRPVLAPALGALPEYRERHGAEWVRTFEPPLRGSTLADALRWCESTARAERCELRGEDWKRIAAGTLEVYEEVLTGAARPTARDELREIA
jgi:beta-1,4-mannosyltransferase